MCWRNAPNVTWGDFSNSCHISKRWKVETSLGWGGDIFPLPWLFLCLQPYCYWLGIKAILLVFFHWQDRSISYQFQVLSQLIIFLLLFKMFLVNLCQDWDICAKAWWDINDRIPSFLSLATWLEYLIVMNLFPGL